MTTVQENIYIALVAAFFCVPATGVTAVVLPINIVLGQTQQSASVLPRFEVVSIRPNKSARTGNISFLTNGYQGENVSLPQLISSAYGLEQQYQLIGLPGWAKSAHYDIAARVSESDISAMRKLGFFRMYRMFQPVLGDRFSLHCHWEKRALPTYTLTAAKKGSKLKESTAEDYSKTVKVGQLDLGADSLAVTADGLIVGRAVPLSRLVELLEDDLETVVVDSTRLTGKYDFQMQVQRASAHKDPFTSGDITPPPEQIHPSDFIQDALYQIGLRLVQTRTDLSGTSDR